MFGHHVAVDPLLGVSLKYSSNYKCVAPGYHVAIDPLEGVSLEY